MYKTIYNFEPSLEVCSPPVSAALSFVNQVGILTVKNGKPISKASGSQP